MVVWDGLGLGAGGVRGGLTVGFGVGLLVVGPGAGRTLDVARFGAAVLACRAWLWPGEGVVLALPVALGLAGPDGLADGVPPCEVVVSAGAEWLNRFMNPTVPTALSKVARQVRVESLRRPSSRRKASRSLCRMGANEIGNCVKSPPRAVQGDALISGYMRQGWTRARVDLNVP